MTLDDGGKTAVIVSDGVSDDILIKTVTDAGYEITGIE